MKNKKGYAMSMVVVSMAVVMALSGLVMMLLSTTTNNQKLQLRSLEENMFVSEISTVYANKKLGDFIGYCESNNWTKSVKESKTTLLSPQNTYTITITQIDGNEQFCFVQTKTKITLAQLHKTNDQVDVWRYQIKE